MTPEQRRQEFITDIVEACKRHRVLLEVIDEAYDWRPEVAFVEAKSDEQGMLFNVDMDVIESAVREAVWPIAQGESK